MIVDDERPDTLDQRRCRPAGGRRHRQHGRSPCTMRARRNDDRPTRTRIFRVRSEGASNPVVRINTYVRAVDGDVLPVGDDASQPTEASTADPSSTRISWVPTTSGSREIWFDASGAPSRVMAVTPRDRR